MSLEGWQSSKYEVEQKTAKRSGARSQQRPVGEEEAILIDGRGEGGGEMEEKCRIRELINRKIAG